MTAEEIFQLAGSSAPEVMEKTASVLQLLERLDPESAAEATLELSLVAEVATGNLDKTAAAGGAQLGRDIGIAAAGGVLATLGTAVAMDMYDAAKRGLSKGMNYKKMMSANPQLHSMDRSRVRSAYDSVHRFGGPEFTADPLASGAIVKHIAELPDFAPEHVMKLINARKMMSETRKAQLHTDAFKPAVDVAMKNYEHSLREPAK